MSPRAKSPHQARIELFMVEGGQYVPKGPSIPTDDVLSLRARLVLEEALETIEAMGFQVDISMIAAPMHVQGEMEKLLTDRHVVELYKVSPREDLDLAEITDGLGDLSVVTIGSLSAFGVADEGVLQEIDSNNLLKTTYPRQENGKIIKPDNHKPPQIHLILEQQAATVAATVHGVSDE